MSDFHMIDVGQKPVTHRIAIAEGFITIGEVAFAHLRDKTLPKGDALMLAQTAGILGAKKAPETMILCHPLPIDQVDITPTLMDDGKTVRIEATVSSHAKTGVEMEALAAVNAALLNLWDLIKMVEPNLLISNVRLLAKKGGKSGLWLNPDGVSEAVLARIKPPLPQVLMGRRVALLTLSDRAANGVYEDRSGPTMRDIVTAFGADVVAQSVMADEGQALQTWINTTRQSHDPHLILLSGGTGLAARDITPQSLEALIDYRVPGIGELLRSDGAQFTPLSWASRSLGGVIGQTLLVALPGSPNAVKEGLGALLPTLLPHLIRILRGE